MRPLVEHQRIARQLARVALALRLGTEPVKAHAGERRMPGCPQRNAPQRQPLPHLTVVVARLEALVLRTDVGKACTHVVRGAGQHNEAHHCGQYRLPLTPPGSTPLASIPSCPYGSAP